ncbi:TraK family protein [Massilia sp. TSP1-1-2]|uniref:TraK family protein n=1 Tax=Massilia sp. TSP1-1-2 TaxID=2804649 RepID=UPI003CEE640A
MTKSYPEQLAEWVKRRESTKRDKNLVAFLAVRDDIKLAVDAGYAVKTIWANMHEEKRVAFGYDTFLNYVNRHIRDKSTRPAEVLPVRLTVDRGRPESKAAPQKQGPKVKAPDAPTGFTFNSQPDVKELI